MVPNTLASPATQAAQPRWLVDSRTLQAWSDDGQEMLAVDTEFVRERTYWPVLALVQMATGDDARLLDPLHAEPLATLGAVLSRPERTILMHSASEDLVALRPLLPVPMRGLYDTQIAAAFAGLGPGVGYQSAVAKLTGVELAKQETRSNWLARPLTQKQIEYALDDVRYLAPMHAELDRRLHERGYRDWHREDCVRLAENSFTAEVDPQPHLAFRSAARWPLAVQAQLRRILRWREQAARERDLPRRWVLDDDSAIAAAMEPQHSAARLAARLADGPAGRRRSLQPLLNLLERPANEDELAATEPAPALQDDALKHTVRRLKAHIDCEAERLDLPPGLLCPRRALEAFARDSRWPAELSGWRQPLLQENLTALL